MISYSNETRVKDIAEPSLKTEIESLLKLVLMDYAIIMTPEVFSHTVSRISYLVAQKYKALMLGEVKYVFEAMTEHLKGRISVATIMQLFSKYYEERIEKQRQENESSEIEYESRLNDCFKSPLGSAIIHKMNLIETGALKMTEWESVPIKEIADKIASGKIKVFMPEKKNKKYRWEL